MYQRSSKPVVHLSFSAFKFQRQSHAYHRYKKPHQRTNPKVSSHEKPRKPIQTQLSQKPIPFITEIKKCDDPNEAISLFYEYHDSGFKHDYPSYSSLIYKLARARNFDSVEIFLDYLKTRDIRCRESLFIALFQHYGKAKMPDKAIELFRKMKSFNCSRSVQSFNTILNVLVDNDCLQEAADMFDGSRELGFRLNSVSYNIMIKTWLQKLDWKNAKKVFDEMLDRKVEPTVVSYNSLIGFLCKNGEFKEAKSLFDDMIKKGKTPNHVTYALLMEGLCSLGNFKEAKKLMFDMEYQGCKPRLINYGVLMNDLGRRGEIDEAKGFLIEMKKRKIKPDVVMYNMLINYLCKEGKVEEAYNILVKMHTVKCEPNAATYRMVVDSFCRIGNFEDGLNVLNAMVKSKHLPRRETFSCLFLGLVKIGKLENAGFLLEEMEGMNIRFELESWESLVVECCWDDDKGNKNQLISEIISSV